MREVGRLSNPVYQVRSVARLLDTSRQCRLIFVMIAKKSLRSHKRLFAAVIPQRIHFASLSGSSAAAAFRPGIFLVRYLMRVRERTFFTRL